MVQGRNGEGWVEGRGRKEQRKERVGIEKVREKKWGVEGRGRERLEEGKVGRYCGFIKIPFKSPGPGGNAEFA